MANDEYEYIVELVVQHPRLSATEIGECFHGLTPRSAVSAGDLTVGKRRAKASVWIFSFCDSRVSTRQKMLSDTLQQFADKLKPFSDAILQLKSGGSVSFDVDIFSHGMCSACDFYSHLLHDLNSIGVDLNLCFYERDSGIAKRPDENE
ncbi:MAG: hypothetical protein EXS06_10500 [Planctomycetaceae bacterium]|nr:hypothetical protein [Planctomycetaceae bacterium]